ncbi:MAG: class I SAM-dependent methyltransferase [Candidatus Pacebacteria bacterium]|nr:class I SAM-dependent methyltransferase [Candidatus Paceibacterota bacterium]
MKQHAFAILHDMERSWWYVGRAHVIEFLSSKAQTKHRILDYGAGYGGMFPWLSRIGAVVDAYEPNATARQGLVKRGYGQVLSTMEEARTGRYDIVGLFDVVEHIEDDVLFLRDIQDALTGSGSLIITVPAYQWLWSSHDADNQHFRRYTRKQLVSRLTQAGYDVQFAGYWNMFLLPLVIGLRFLGSSGEGGLGLPPIVNSLLKSVISLEVALMHLFPLPCGVSVVAIAIPKRTHEYGRQGQ